ncbi:MAG: hypothetical protein U0Q14_08410 [Dermatophilaceae bacterium]
MTPDRVGVGTALEAVERLVVEEERRLHAQVGELATVRAAISGLAVELGAQVKPSHGLVLTDDLSGIVESRPSWHRAWVSVPELAACENGTGLHADIGLTWDISSRRTIYPVAILDSAVALRTLGSRVLAGEEQRLTTLELPTFAVLDDLAVVGAGDAYGIVRDSSLVALLAGLHELSWDRADEIPTREAAGSTDAAVLTLLSRGLKDEAIARYLGLSLRTVRRRVAALMTRYGADTRFALGVQCAARGLVPVVGPRRRAAVGS